MSQEVQKRRRLSLITDFIIFIIFLSLVLGAIKLFNLTDEQEEQDETISEQISPLANLYTDVSDENNLFVQKIKNEYGITVEYGENTKNYVDKVSATIQNSAEIINSNIKNIYESLSKYPVNLFDIFKSGKYPMYIIILDKFENDNIALASRNKLNEYRIYISNNTKMERSFHHEMFHILEYYMASINNNSSVYDMWENLNPIGFIYQSDTSKINKEYVYDSDNCKLEDAYFVTKYSKASEKEDRAEIFAEIMVMSKRKEYLGKDGKIYLKAKNIMDKIEENITDNNFYCNRFLN